MDEVAVRNPALDELVYTVLYEMPYKLVRGLDEKYARIVSNEKAARKFANTCTREEMEYIFSLAGIEYFYVFSPKKVSRPKFLELLMLYQKNQKGKALDTIIENHIFVHSDTTFSRLLSLASSTVHHPNYFLNVELIRAGSDFKKWKKRNINPESLLNREADELTRVIAKERLTTMKVGYRTKSLFELSNIDCMVLLHLYISYDSVEFDVLVKEFEQEGNRISIRNSVTFLETEHFITKDLSSKKNSYNLTGLGVKKAATILNEINKRS